MIELLTTNPEIINNNRTNPKIAASLCNSGFKPQSLRMIKVAENSSAIIIGNTQAQDYSDKYLFLDSSGLINIDCSKLIVSKMIKFDRISRIMVDNADYDTISTSHLVGSTNLPFIFGEAANADASAISEVSNSICIRGYYTPVRKAADAPQGSGHSPPHQDDAHNANADAEAEAEGVNAEDGAAAMNDNAGEDNNANDGGGNGGGGGGGGDDADGGVLVAIATVMAILIGIMMVAMIIGIVIATARR